MKKLESLKEFQIKNEMNDVNGGVSGSGLWNGSKFSYDGEITNTLGSTEIVLGITNYNYTTDFCGVASYDASTISKCFSFN